MLIASCGSKPATSSNNPVTSAPAPTTSETVSSQEQPSSAPVSSSENVSSEASSSFASSSEQPSSQAISSNEQISSSEQVSSSEQISSSEVISSSEQPSSSAAPSSSQTPSSSQASSSSEAPSSSSQAPSSSSQPSSSSSSSSSYIEEQRIVDLELFAINDTHGTVYDSSSALGISKTATLLKTYPNNVNNALYISQGDMWQGSAASNITRGALMNDWMNYLGFTSMTVGNHEFDWTTSYIKTNVAKANFPYLGINVYDKTTNQRVDYLDASTIIEKNGAKIGIVGAIGDCYDSISASMVPDVYFVVGEELSNLVKAEATRLKNEEHCDVVIYSVHDGDDRYDDFVNYDITISDYVDLVLEGHSHVSYAKMDSKGVYHIQSAGYNRTISYLDITINCFTNSLVVNDAQTIWTNNYDYLSTDPQVEAILESYADQINSSNDPIGYNSSYRADYELADKVAELYLEKGSDLWGSNYNIVLGGGYISPRQPYSLSEGWVTYSDLYTLFPFDNDLVLCTISGYNLKYKFFQTSQATYHMSYTSYGQSLKDSGYINYYDTFYVVVDTYTSDYSSNGLTVVETLSGYYARDMLADYIAAGNWE